MENLQQLLVAALATSAASRVISLDYITVSGSTEAGIDIYKGIPFASPPTGANRWMPPKPPKKYDGVFDATKFGAGCLASFPGGAPPAPPAPPAGGSTTTSLPSTTPLQRRQTGVAISTSIPGGGAPLPSGPPPAGASSEDCLFINVFTPSSSTPSSKLPVLMWTYGGAFMGGSSSTFNGSSIVKASNESLVYVSFNYRVGVMGFFSNKDLLDEGHGANYGLLDQRAAYDWVKQNIGRFGGDPKRITAFGESAGSQSVSLQTILFDGLRAPFQAAIMESGTYTSFHDTLSVQDQTDYAATLGAKVGCTPGTKAFVNCLRGVNASVIMANVAGQEWRPTVDKTVLKEMPLKRVLKGRFAKVPVIMGTNTNEGTMFARSVTKSTDFIPFLQSNFKWLSPANMTTVESLYAAESFPSPLLRAAEVFGDAVFVCPSQKFSQVRSLVPGLTDYRYRFNYSSPTSTLLAAHGSEISFVYNSATATPASLAKLMSTLWVSFAITGGDPNAKTPSSFSTPTGLKWPKYTVSEKKSLVLDATQSVEVDGAYMKGHVERCAFWEKIDLEMAASREVY